jgi:hypothetical protein
MADTQPTWEAIAGKLVDILKQENAAASAFSPYPENAIDALDLPSVVVNEPKNVTMKPFTFGSFITTYEGDLTLFVKWIDTGQARLKSGDINQITAATLKLYTVVHANRSLGKFVSNIALGEAKMARLSPYDDDNRGHYAGMDIPYTITMQYRSGS